MHILPIISRHKGSQKMKFGQLIEYNTRKMFLKNYTQIVMEKLSPDPFLKGQNWAYLWISRMLQQNMSFFVLTILTGKNVETNSIYKFVKFEPCLIFEPFLICLHIQSSSVNFISWLSGQIKRLRRRWLIKKPEMKHLLLRSKFYGKTWVDFLV